MESELEELLEEMESKVSELKDYTYYPYKDLEDYCNKLRSIIIKHF